MVKEFWFIIIKDRIAGVEFFTRDCNVTLTSHEHCSRLQQSCCHAVIEDRMIPFAAYTAAEFPNAFNGQITPKLPFPWGISTPSSRPTWFLGPTWVSPQRHLYRFSRFCSALPCDQHRQTQTTLRSTSLALGRIYAMHVMRPNIYNIYS